MRRASSRSQRLLDHGADRKAVDDDGRTAADFADQKGFTDIVEMLER